MTQHTEGPWRYEPETKTIRSVPANYWLASMDSWDGAVNHEANARLMAAAPKLLAALEQVIKYLEEGTLVRDITQDAKPEWGMKMMYFVRDLQSWQTAITEAKAS